MNIHASVILKLFQDLQRHEQPYEMLKQFQHDEFLGGNL